ncbi:hypothetical protein ABB22_16875 [Stenotrophomonas nitritireducens]|uniref:Uncharacterized protein n=2 Tax=Stenotrophomonas nitritireducens TaxID=83617 RepID=A0ABR5NFR4_9GAMM|nr:hypothetical protein ABB22_16875 [Stenotrophomonas nitritireducens]
MNEIRLRLRKAEAHLNYSLDVFGDSLGKKHGWKNTLDGLEAVRYYLMQKHHWTPSQLQAMSLEDLRFALTEEMHGWRLPKDAIGPKGS